MGSLNPFQKPKVTTPVIQTVTESAPALSDEQVAAAAEEERKKLARSRGRAATMLATGDDTGGIATKKLMGG